MSDTIAEPIREKLEGLCRTISVARELDGEIRRELYAHMEDKFLAYVRGEIPLSDEDAFILVR